MDETAKRVSYAVLLSMLTTRDVLEDITWMAASPQLTTAERRFRAILWYCAQARDESEELILEHEENLASEERLLIDVRGAAGMRHAFLQQIREAAVQLHREVL